MDPRPRGSLTARVTRRLRQAILEGELGLGAALSEERLATTLGVSRSPVREAFTALEQQGLIDVQPQRGSFVFLPSREDMDDLCEFRKMVELEALRLAMHRKRAETLAVMKKAAADMEAALDREDNLGSARADAEFHGAAIDNCGNPYLVNAYRLASGKVAALRSHGSTLPTRRVASAEHFAILEHLEADDLRRALDALGTHILKMAERYGFDPTSGGPTVVRGSRTARSASLDHIGPLRD